MVRTGPKTGIEKESILTKVHNLVVTGELYEKSLTQIAHELKISRFTLRDYISKAYQSIDLVPESQIKKVKDTRQYLINTLLDDFRKCDDSTQRNVLSKTISSLLDSQEKASLVMIQLKGENKEEVKTSGTGFYTNYLSKLKHEPVSMEEQ